MATPERSVLHVLPHPGGGGEAYVHVLSDMPGYHFETTYMASSPTPSPSQLGRGVVEATRRARKHDLVHVHGEVAGGLCLPLLVTLPSVLTLHGLHLVRRLSGIRRMAAALNLRAILRAADTTICVSRAEHAELLRVVGAVAARRAVVIRNGVRLPPPRSEIDRAAVRAELGIPQSEPVGIWVGSLDERKDPLTAVHAANRADVTLLVVGDGPLHSDVERTAGEHVCVLGQRGDLPRLLAAADFYVLTSRREGLALSLLEAMAAGLAPIATDLPENREAVGETGMTVPVGDEAAVLEAMRRLAVETDETAASGARARQRITELFDMAQMTTATRAAYESTLVDRHGG